MGDALVAQHLLRMRPVGGQHPAGIMRMQADIHRQFAFRADMLDREHAPGTLRLAKRPVGSGG